jgi:hypothetical protein
VIQSVDEVKLGLDSAMLGMRGGLDALKGQGARIEQSIEHSIEQAERRIGEVAGTMVEIQNGLKALKEQSTKTTQSMELAKLRMLHVAIVSKGGTLVLTASLCRRSSSEDL